MHPPKDDLIAALEESLPEIKNGDVLCISSKVIAIDEGRCVQGNKDDFIQEETNLYIPREKNKYRFCLSIIHHALISSAGIDKSNSGDYLTLLPKNPSASAKRICLWIKEKYSISDIAVIVTDSHTTPLRNGISGISIGAYGMQPLKDYRKTKDLFDYEIKMSRSNMIDPIASAAVNIMGEGNEQTPIVLVRNWPNVQFCIEDTWQDFVVDPEDDVYWPLLKEFKRDD